MNLSTFLDKKIPARFSRGDFWIDIGLISAFLLLILEFLLQSLESVEVTECGLLDLRGHDLLSCGFLLAAGL